MDNVVYIKQVSDRRPNSVGNWISASISDIEYLRVTNREPYGPDRKVLSRFDILTRYCSKGHHAVAYKPKSEEG